MRHAEKGVTLRFEDDEADVSFEFSIFYILSFSDGWLAGISQIIPPSMFKSAGCFAAEGP